MKQMLSIPKKNIQYNTNLTTSKQASLTAHVTPQILSKILSCEKANDSIIRQQGFAYPNLRHGTSPIEGQW